MPSDAPQYACQGLFDDLLRCLSDSPCVINHEDKQKALLECSHADAEGVSEACKVTRAAYTQCRRAQADNRRRIRGPPKY